MSEKQQNSPFPWGPAAASGVGSMPGGDAREAARTVVGSLEAPPHLPYLPELPARGPGADMLGRTAGMLAEMYVHLEPSGWRISDRPGRDTRRARAWLREDLDALEEFCSDWEPGAVRAVKVSAVGPWTLAAGLERRNGEVMLGDPGAYRDLTASLAEGLREHVADVRRRVPGAAVVLQLDEPSLTSVLLGRVRTASGYRTHTAVDRAVVEGALRELLSGHEGPTVVHSCAPGVPFGLLRRAGADAISLDATLLTEREDEAIGEAVEAGVALLAGVVPSTGASPDDGAGAVPDAAAGSSGDTGSGVTGGLSDPAGSVRGVRSLWRRLGLAPGLLAESVVVTPSCGLAHASPAYARRALAHCVQAARSLADNPE